MPDGKWVSKANLQTFWQMIRSKVLPTMIGDTVTTWLTEHVDPVGSAVVVDDTLTIQGAAADAKKTGDEISGLKEDLDESVKALEDNILKETNNKARIFRNELLNSQYYSVELSDYNIIINGSGSVQERIKVSLPITLQPGTYSGKMIPLNDAGTRMRTRIIVYLLGNDGSVVHRFLNSAASSFTITNNTDVTISLYVGNNSSESVFENCQYQLMLNEGSSVLEYEKPYKIVNEEDVEEELTVIINRIETIENSQERFLVDTHNLAKIYTNKNLTASAYSLSIKNYSITINGSGANANVNISDRIVFPPGTYIGVVIPKNDSAYSMRTRVACSMVKNDGTALARYSNSSVSFTITEDTEIVFRLYIGASEVTSTFNNAEYVIMLNEGSDILEYEPPYELTHEEIDYYIPPVTLVNQDILNGIPTRSLSFASGDFLAPVYKGIKVIDSNYRFYVYRYTKNYAFIDRNQYESTQNELDYAFNFDAYNYKVAVRKLDASRAENLVDSSKAIKLIVSLNRINALLAEIAEKDNRNAYIAKNNDAIKKIMMKSNYNIRYANSARQLPLINCYGNTQNVHPKVLYFPEGFGGHYYWMAYTPYPYARVQTENPCVAFSDDGINFTDISANPIDIPATSDGTHYNSDTHLVFVNGTLECWYRYVEPDNEYIYRQKSQDGITWGSKELLYTSGAHSNVLCPIVIYEDSLYKIWVINNSTKKIDYYESADGSGWNLVRTITAGSFSYNGLTYYPWHGDVIHDGEQYVMVMMCKNTTGADAWVSCMQTSSDNVTYGDPVVILGGGLWDNTQYRISITKIEGLYRLYYSGIGRDTLNNAVYGIGISESDTLNEFIGVNY